MSIEACHCTKLPMGDREHAIIPTDMHSFIVLLKSCEHKIDSQVGHYDIVLSIFGAMFRHNYLVSLGAVCYKCAFLVFEF